MKLLKLSITVLIFSVVGCYSPDKNNLNEKASLNTLGDLPENPLLLIPMTFSINPKLSTMSTLYGNKKAMESAKKNKTGSYPPGALLYEVTWKQKADSLWYGANIPDRIIRVERIQFNNDSVPEYQLYSGSPLRKIHSDFPDKEISTIISQPVAVSP
ncbi:MAG: cytochrome P460 family protein [Flavobacterium sp.]